MVFLPDIIENLQVSKFILCLFTLAEKPSIQNFRVKLRHVQKYESCKLASLGADMILELNLRRIAVCTVIKAGNVFDNAENFGIR